MPGDQRSVLIAELNLPGPHPDSRGQHSYVCVISRGVAVGGNFQRSSVVFIPVCFYYFVLRNDADSNCACQDVFWSYVDYEQAIARCLRLGQKREVDAFVLYGKGTIEEEMFALAMSKEKIMDTFVGRSGREHTLQLLGSPTSFLDEGDSNDPTPPPQTPIRRFPTDSDEAYPCSALRASIARLQSRGGATRPPSPTSPTPPSSPTPLPHPSRQSYRLPPRPGGTPSGTNIGNLNSQSSKFPMLSDTEQLSPHGHLGSESLLTEGLVGAISTPVVRLLKSTVPDTDSRGSSLDPTTVLNTQGADSVPSSISPPCTPMVQHDETPSAPRRQSQGSGFTYPPGTPPPLTSGGREWPCLGDARPSDPVVVGVISDNRFLEDFLCSRAKEQDPAARGVGLLSNSATESFAVGGNQHQIEGSMTTPSDRAHSNGHTRQECSQVLHVEPAKLEPKKPQSFHTITKQPFRSYYVPFRLDQQKHNATDSMGWVPPSPHSPAPLWEPMHPALSQLRVWKVGVMSGLHLRLEWLLCPRLGRTTAKTTPPYYQAHQTRGLKRSPIESHTSCRLQEKEIVRVTL